MLSHFPLLVRTEMQVTLRFPSADQRESCFFVFRKIGIRTGLIDHSAQDSAGACQAPALVANCRQHNSVPCGRIPDEFISVADERALAFRRLQHNQMSFSSVHAAAWLCSIVYGL
jgi:hypothetical protein